VVNFGQKNRNVLKTKAESKSWQYYEIKNKCHVAHDCKLKQPHLVLTAAKFIAVRFLLLFAAFVYVKIDIKFEMLNSAAEVLSPVYDLGLWEFAICASSYVLYLC